MSLLDLYNRGAINGIAGPSAKRRTELLDGASNLRPDNPGAFGDTYADELLQAQRTGTNQLVTRVSGVGAQPATRYITNIFNQTSTRTNNLLKRAADSNTYGPNRFPTDIIPYTDRVFMQQNASLGQASLIPSVLATATKTVPVLTPTDDKNVIGTSRTEVLDDGRYVCTVGYGFVLYVTNSGYV